MCDSMGGIFVGRAMEVDMKKVVYIAGCKDSGVTGSKRSREGVPRVRRLQGLTTPHHTSEDSALSYQLCSV